MSQLLFCLLRSWLSFPSSTLRSSELPLISSFPNKSPSLVCLFFLQNHTYLCPILPVCYITTLVQFLITFYWNHCNWLYLTNLCMSVTLILKHTSAQVIFNIFPAWYLEHNRFCVHGTVSLCLISSGTLTGSDIWACKTGNSPWMVMNPPQ